METAQITPPVSREADRWLRETIRQVVREEIAQGDPTWNWLTAKQAGELLGISPHRVSARVREGKLPGKKFGGRTYVDREALEQQLKRRGR